MLRRGDVPMREPVAGVPEMFRRYTSIVFCKKKKISFLNLCDFCAPYLALAQSIGRWGNFANQEVYGNVVSNSSLQWFPMAVYINATGQWHYSLFF